jgi:hypothetical protein
VSTAALRASNSSRLQTRSGGRPPDGGDRGPVNPDSASTCVTVGLVLPLTARNQAKAAIIRASAAANERMSPLLLQATASRRNITARTTITRLTKFALRSSRPRTFSQAGNGSVSSTNRTRQGRLARVGRGLYALPDRSVSDHSTLPEVARKHPRAVVCLLSVLRFHELTTQAPFEVWLAIPNKARAPSLGTLHRSEPLRIVRFPEIDLVYTWRSVGPGPPGGLRRAYPDPGEGRASTGAQPRCPMGYPSVSRKASPRAARGTLHRRVAGKGEQDNANQL